MQQPLKRSRRPCPASLKCSATARRCRDFDLYCPLLGLPIAFKTDLASIPANIPYLRPYHGRLEKWRARMPQNGRLRVGIVWAGNSTHLNDRNRSIALERFAALFVGAGHRLHQRAERRQRGAGGDLRAHGVLQLGQQFTDFADTAAVVAMLDLLVTVDTSVAHLAGAMGKAVALLLPFSPDFRWLLHRTDSPWYPSMRLFRQPVTGDWNTPIEKLRQELADVARRPVVRT